MKTLDSSLVKKAFLKSVLILLCFSSTTLFAGSIRLYNDSPYKLRAVIRGADGTYLGEMILLPEHFNTWSDSYPSFGSGGQNYSENPNQAMTPYTVQWYCAEGGGVYGISTNVPTGGAIMSESADGPRICIPPQKKNQSPYGPKEGDEKLQDQNSLPSQPNQ